MSTEKAPSYLINPTTTETASISLTHPSASDPLIPKEHDGDPPQLSLWRIFIIFLGFGLRAWGGPMAQIALIKDELILRDKWITIQKFNRVFAVYQLLPGPEAFELCVYFGVISGGRLGGVAAGLGFMLPGFGLMLLLSWAYVRYGLSNEYFRASLEAMNTAVAALYMRAVHKIGQHAVLSPTDATQVNWVLMTLIMVSIGMQVFMRVHFFITLAVIAVANLGAQRRIYWGLGLILLLGIPLYVLYILWVGYPSGFSFGINMGKATYWSAFLLGLIAGLVSVGGAFSAVPFLQSSGLKGGWITQQQFLIGIALSNVIPAPMVIFSTFVGYVAAGWIGAVLMTLGMFLPAFLFPIIGHDLFEALLRNHTVGLLLDGVMAAVLGAVAIIALQFMSAAIISPITAVLYLITLGALYLWNHPALSPIVIFLFAIAGQFRSAYVKYRHIIQSLCLPRT